MSYIEYDPTNPELFDNYVPTSQRRMKKIIKDLVIAGIVCIVIYLIYTDSDTDDEPDILIS